MDTIKSIIERRSIRKYTNKEISDLELNKLLEAAMYAPSGGNAQPWDFVVIRDKEKLLRITDVHPYSHPLKEANLAIVVCGNMKKEKFPGLWIQDCSAATQNILLAATDLGIGSVWLGIYPEEDRVNGLKDIIEAPDHIIPFSVVSLGYPDEKKKTPERFSQMNVHMEKW
jgi:nitroreductase